MFGGQLDRPLRNWCEISHLVSGFVVLPELRALTSAFTTNILAFERLIFGGREIYRAMTFSHGKGIHRACYNAHLLAVTHDDVSLP